MMGEFIDDMRVAGLKLRVNRVYTKTRDYTSWSMECTGGSHYCTKSPRSVPEGLVRELKVL